jgi:hypothetical protein
MQAAAREDIGIAPGAGNIVTGATLEELPEIAEVVEFPETASGFESSFFHIGHLDIENWIFEAAYRRAGWKLRLGRVNIVHDLAAVNKNGG